MTLIKGTDIFKNVQLLSGYCNTCETIYYADHEHTASTVNTEAMQLYQNTALYIKVGQKLWVDCKFSTSVMNGTYHLHASTSGWANYFNDTYGNNCIPLSHCQVWAAFVQESIWQVSEISKLDFIT